MKQKEIVVSTWEDLEGAIEYTRRAAESRGGERSAAVCSLLCEELLSHLLSRGYTGIRLSCAGLVFRRVQLTVAGEEDSLDEPESSRDENRVEREINRNLLNQYMDWMEFSYQKGVNRYSIYIDQKPQPDLREEIFNFYHTADEKARQKPMAVIWAIARNHKGRVAFSVLIRTIKHLAALMLPVFASHIIDVLSRTGSILNREVLWYVIASFLCLGANLICFGIDTYVYHRFTRAIEAGFRMALVQKVEVLSIQFHNQSRSGTLLSKMISDVQYIQTLLFDRFTDVLHLAIDIVFVIVTALLRYPPMLLFYILIVPATILLVRSFSHPILEARTRMRKQMEKGNASFNEMFQMNLLTRVHGLKDLEYRDISSKVQKIQKSANVYDRMSFYVNNVSFGGFQGFRIVCLVFAAYLATRGAIGVGTVVLFASIFDMIIASMQKVLDSIPDITQGVDSLISVNEVLWETDEERSGDVKPPVPLKGEIRLKDVVFRYANAETPVLSGITLDIPAGKTVAFIGRSGEGKTTLMNLMLGLFEKQSGSLTIDGIDMDDLNKQAYRHQIAVVPQNTVLFTGTLWENLVYGLQYISTARVMEVLESVGLTELVSSLPEGLDSVIQEGGANFSGGQRQRIAIARALLRDARIVFFDEATSALDTENEARVQQAVDALMGHATVVMIAHHLNTLKKADAVYRVENGKAVLTHELSLEEKENE